MHHVAAAPFSSFTLVSNWYVGIIKYCLIGCLADYTKQYIQFYNIYVCTSYINFLLGVASIVGYISVKNKYDSEMMAE